jgi:hypothetical protein
MKTLLSLALLATTLFTSASVTAKAFEGTIQMTMSDGSGQPRPLAYSIKQGLVRTDIQAEGMMATAILNFAKDEMIMLMPGQPMYMVMPLKSSASKATGQNVEQSTLENTGMKEKILGYECTKYLVRSKEGITEIWATEELGEFMGLGGGMSGPMGKGNAPSGWEKALVGKSFFPLRVVSNTGKKEKFRLETTAVERKSLPDSHFAPPAGYQKFDMGGMMQGLGGNPFAK